jgi:hypothetical protein
MWWRRRWLNNAKCFFFTYGFFCDCGFIFSCGFVFVGVIIINTIFFINSVVVGTIFLVFLGDIDTTLPKLQHQAHCA